MSDPQAPSPSNETTDAKPKVKRKRRRLYQADPDQVTQPETESVASDPQPEPVVAEIVDERPHAAKTETPETPPPSQTLQTDVRGLLDLQFRTNRLLKARNTVKNHVVATMSLALVPVPVFDVLAVSASLVELVEKLAGLYGFPPNRNRFRTLVAALIGGFGSYGLSTLSVHSLGKLIPGWRWFAAGAAMPLAAGAVTYAVGSVLLHHLEAGGTLDQLDVHALRADYQQQVDKGYSLAKQWSRTASTSS